MDIETFEGLAREFNVIPLARTLAADTLTPVAIYLAVRRAGERGFLFESVEGGRHVNLLALEVDHAGVQRRTLLRGRLDARHWRTSAGAVCARRTAGGAAR